MVCKKTRKGEKNNEGTPSKYKEDDVFEERGEK
jgi:CRISPR/Cas system-associated protein Cas7 (RAMP superfamily)